MGDPEAPIAAPETLGEVRANEVREAGRMMGVASVTVRDWGDGKVAQADPRAVEDDILVWLREHRPDVLVTWGPDGGYRHLDHIAAGERCIAALKRAGDAPPGKVYRMVYEKEWEVMVRHWPDWAIVKTLVPWRDDQLGSLIALTEEELDLKWAAMQTHRTQLPDLRNYEQRSAPSGRRCATRPTSGTSRCRTAAWSVTCSSADPT